MLKSYYTRLVQNLKKLKTKKLNNIFKEVDRINWVVTDENITRVQARAMFD